MTTEQLIAECQTYYGMEYSRGMGRVVMQYLDTIPDKVKPFLFAQTVKSHSSSFRALPDVSTFEAAIEEAWEAFYNENPTQYLPPPEYPTDDELATDEDWAAFVADMKAKLNPDDHEKLESLVVRLQGRKMPRERRGKPAPERRDPYKN